ncbi:MAG TPA: glycosyl hydrolase 108 family protein [Xanthomonadaceae bacterium]|jgi:lysozyme family protein
MPFDTCLPVILRNEGGFVDDPHDPGGATNLGITLNTLSTWEGHTASIEEVKALTKDSVAPIYQALYWNVARCGDCPPGVDLMVFDEAVNQGPGRAIRSLQQALGVTADGSFGPRTLASLDKADPATTIKAMAAICEAYYRSLTNFPRYGHGWLNRLRTTTATALAMVAAAVAPTAGG